MAVYFYHSRDQYTCFSNFSPHGFMLDDLYWLSREHYFQAQKFLGTSHLEQIRLVKTPKDAAKMGRQRTRPLPSDWEPLKDDK